MTDGRDKIHVLSRAVIIDNNNILLCKTLDLDIQFYYLPGGHIENGESAQQALLRELQEEVGVECKIHRFLGCLEYNFKPEHDNICHNHEYNLVFEAGNENLKSDMPLSSQEEHIGLEWVPIDKLKDIDFRAEPLKELLPKWLSQESNTSFISAAEDLPT